MAEYCCRGARRGIIRGWRPVRRDKIQDHVLPPNHEHERLVNLGGTSRAVQMLGTLDFAWVNLNLRFAAKRMMYGLFDSTRLAYIAICSYMLTLSIVSPMISCSPAFQRSSSAVEFFSLDRVQAFRCPRIAEPPVSIGQPSPPDQNVSVSGLGGSCTKTPLLKHSLNAGAA